MIQPEGLYAAFKKAPNPTVLGRLGFALAGREAELDRPLDAVERWMFDTMFELNKWHNESREALKERWKSRKQKQRTTDEIAEDCAGQDGCRPTTDAAPEKRDIPADRTAKKSCGFKKPTVEEIAAYCQERKNKIDPEAFFDFYESKKRKSDGAWMVGSDPMGDWKAAARTWERRDAKDRKCAGGNRRSTHYREGGLDVGV